jgi:hypothetical protein
MINNSSALPPFEGPITANPDTGEPFVVTIPFLGVKGLASTPGSDGARLALRDGLNVTLTAGPTSPTGLATFSSGGPGSPDGRLKPDITAPGNPIISTGFGTGNQALSDSGTSMASPHIAGTAALGRQAHPNWNASQIKSAIINSGNPSAIVPYVIHDAGTGLVNAASVAHTQVLATADNDATTMNFGVIEFSKDFNGNDNIKLRNDGNTDASFYVTVEQQQGSPHNAVLSTSLVKVKAHGTNSVQFSLNVPAATAGDSSDFREVAGLVKFAPVTAADNAGVTLRVPYYLVSRVSANVSANFDKNIKKNNLSANVLLTNKKSPITATADFYSWGLQAKGGKKNKVVDLNAAGVQSFPGGGDAVLVFAVNAVEPWSAPQQRQFNVLIDLDGDGNADYIVFNVDFGFITAGAYSGEMIAAIMNVATGDISADYDIPTTTDTSTMFLVVNASSIGVTPAGPRFLYGVNGFDTQSSAQDTFGTFAPFNAFNSSISTGGFATLPSNGTGSVPISVNQFEWAITPSLGVMVVTPDNQNGTSEVNLLGVKL